MTHTTCRSRRGFLKKLAAAGCAWPGFSSLCSTAAERGLPPVRVITRGPKHHWFGYYDKHEFDPTDRYVLGMEVDFEHRTPRPDDVIKIGMVDLHSHDTWTEIGQSSAWCWQQGCMLQWIPGSRSRILWNDRDENGRYVCRIFDTDTGQRRTIDSAVYAVSPDGRTAVTTDFRRIADVRPGYGYAGIPDPYADDPAPQESGIWRVDLETGQKQLVISLEEIAGLGTIPRPEPRIKHYFNHLLFNPDGSRFVFLHRWRYANGSRLTRMITADPDGKQVRIVDDNGLTSHFIWRDPRHILAFSEQKPLGRGFYLFEDQVDGSIELIGEKTMRNDGHCSYLPGNEWILNDSYPDRDRNQMPFLYHPKTDRIVPLGYFRSPREYAGEWRCDTHPRFSRDGTLVVIDSPYQDEGRQLHLIDISRIAS